MFSKRKKRKAPSLNTTSTADISFMLLTFFLVTSSMDIDKVLTRPLPREEKEEPTEVSIDKSRVLKISISESNKISLNDSAIARQRFRQGVEDFLKKHRRDHLIVIDAHPQADYATYFFVENEMAAAYDNLRNRYATTRYGHSLRECTDEQKAEVAKAFPMRISETDSHTPEYQGTAQEKGGQHVH